MKKELTEIITLQESTPLKTETTRYTNSFTEQDMAKASINAYLSDWEDFCMWCTQKHCQFIPANPHDVADYLEDRAKNTWVGLSGKKRELKEKQPLKWNSLDRRLTAIAKIHKYNNHYFNRKDPSIQRTLKGIKRVLSKEQTHQIIESRKSPVLVEDMRKMIDALPKNLSGTRDKALLLLGFCGALRRSELANIHKEHLQLVKEGLVLLLPWSKTGMREINIPYGSNIETCPVRSVQEWMHAAHIETGAVFRAINRHGQIKKSAISDKSIALIITRNAYVCEIVATAKEEKTRDSTVLIPDFGGHSLRAGFVTQAILNNVPEHSIMSHTGHKKSDTLKKYIREVNKWKNNAAMKLGL
jgi:integrase